MDRRCSGAEVPNSASARARKFAGSWMIEIDCLSLCTSRWIFNVPLMEEKMDATNEARLEVGSGQVPLALSRTMPTPVSQIGFWSATFATVFSIGYGVTLIIMMVSTIATEIPPGLSGIELFVAAFRPVQMLPLIPSLLLAPTFVILMVSIHYHAAPDKKIWSHLGIAFGLIYAVMASINYITQLTIVRLSILSKETDGLSMFVMGNSHSMFWALASAYAFMNLAMLFTAPVFEGGKLERSIRRLFFANGISVVITIFGVVVDSPPVYLLGSLVPWCVIFSWATSLLAVMFKRAEGTVGT
jgi:hypothetical protein